MQHGFDQTVNEIGLRGSCNSSRAAGLLCVPYSLNRSVHHKGMKQTAKSSSWLEREMHQSSEIVAGGLFTAAVSLRVAHGTQQSRELYAVFLCACSLVALTRCSPTRNNTKLRKLFVSLAFLKDRHWQRRGSSQNTITAFIRSVVAPPTAAGIVETGQRMPLLHASAHTAEITHNNLGNHAQNEGGASPPNTR